ncbi:MAG: cytochrome c [Magnetococcales bacterium]|nr:cytochrome c [Magnetococcales bacterium]
MSVRILLHRAVLIATFLFPSALLASQEGAEISPERQSQLIHLLRHDCGSCHGMTLKGGLGPSLLPDALAGKAPDLLENIIYFGLPERAMPPWEGLLTRGEIHWLVERLQKGEIP